MMHGQQNTIVHIYSGSSDVHVPHDLFLSKRKHLKVLLGTDKGY